MARLTAKSFEQRSPDHDALLCECTSNEGAENIISQSIEEFLKGDFLKQRMLTAMPLVRKGLHNPFSAEVEQRGESSEYDFLLYDDLQLYDHLEYENDIEYSYEVERLVMKSDGYLFGYADLILDYNVVIKPYFAFELDSDQEKRIEFTESPKSHLKSEKMLDDSTIWLEMSNEYVYFFNINKKGTILVELKPRLYDIGAVLRQVKTYRKYLPNITDTVIATFSEISDNICEIAKNEGVIIATFEGEIKEDTSNEKILQNCIKQASKMSQEPATKKQLKLLRELDYGGEVHNKLEASAIIIDRLSERR